MSDEHGSARIEGRAQALRPSVPLYRHMLYGSGLPQPLDFLVLAHIHYMCEDGKTFCVDDLVDALRNEGVLSANGKGLIGSKAVYQSVARLREAGFLHRAQANGGNFGKVSYTFYEFPSLNPHWTLPSLPDPVGLSGEAEEGNDISAGQTASPDKARADKARADRLHGNRHVSAGQTASPDRLRGRSSPPHPPEEVGTTSPSPHKPATVSRRNRQAAPEVAPEAAAAAAAFLRNLPGKWAAGLQRAESLAPWLVRNAELTGWELDMSLRIYLTHQEDGQKPPTNYGNVLGYRIKNMQPREAVMAAAAEDKKAKEQGAATGSSSSRLPDWCGECNRGERPAMVYMRVIPSDDVDDDTVVRCPRCHPALARRT